jgi:hypothetical protein
MGNAEIIHFHNKVGIVAFALEKISPRIPIRRPNCFLVGGSLCAGELHLGEGCRRILKQQLGSRKPSGTRLSEG